MQAWRNDFSGASVSRWNPACVGMTALLIYWNPAITSLRRKRKGILAINAIESVTAVPM